MSMHPLLFVVVSIFTWFFMEMGYSAYQDFLKKSNDNLP